MLWRKRKREGSAVGGKLWDGEGRIDAYSSPEREGLVLRFETVMVFREREVGSRAAGAACERKACRERSRK